MLTSSAFRTAFYALLPILCAVLLESHISFLIQHGTSSVMYFQVVMQLLIESLPFFIAHLLVNSTQRFRAVISWSLGFICYPLLSFVISLQSSAYSEWSLLTSQGWWMASLASIVWYVHRALINRDRSRSMQFLSTLFSLNLVLATLLVGWAIVAAGIFNSYANPMENQPLKAVVDVTQIFTEFGRFFGYLWQFLLMAGGVFSIYAINRYILIRQLLTTQGMLAFFMGALICIIIVTPLGAAFVLWLPLNTANFTLLPSENHQIFSPINYQFTFWVLAISTPLILAFERQQQMTAFAQIAQQQTQTELKLLQQQINPHFLFNTLNNLYALTLTKSDDAPHLVMGLSNLLRYTVYEGQKEQVSLSQEIAYLQDYIALQKIRSNDKCSLDLKWPDNGDQVTIPPLLLIMLLENAFKYGVEPSVEQSFIRFHMELVENNLCVVCENRIFSHTQDEPSGVGLENLRRRLTLLFPDKHQLISEPADGLWRAKMTLELRSC